MTWKKTLYKTCTVAFLGILAFLPAFGLNKALTEYKPTLYEFTVDTSWLTMKDGVQLSVTYFKPRPRTASEKFPVLFEFLPYRKDDSFYMRDYPLYSYFVRRGFIMAKVDIRGTGSSEDAVPPHEYSDVELGDAVEIIDQLSKMTGSTGNVGMWGISWGGFNAIQVAMHQPPALKAILAIHASDDLYHDDVRYIDGALHIDEYALSIDHENGLPRTPDYALDEAYFRNRFNVYPWLLAYLKQPLDGEFWRKNSLRWQYEKIQIPVYLIGGLLDGYKDTVPRMLENIKVPIKAEIGPWNHAWPDNGEPGPNYEWRHEAVRWWDHWLKGKETGVLNDPRFTVFLREGHGPDISQKTTPGRWICTDWPIPGTTWKTLFPSAHSRLQLSPGQPSEEKLRYVPSYGTATGLWWGEPTGDMRPDDAGSLIFDSEEVNEPIEIIGFPRVHLQVSVDAPLAHWVARLEDIQPDGRVSLITGALLNGSQRNSRLAPEPLIPGETINIEFELHFTTWTFQPGHRIRLSVSNALFPMIWPSPYPMTSKLRIGIKETRIELPLIPSKKWDAPRFLLPEPREERADARRISGASWPQGLYEFRRDLWNSRASVEWKTSTEFEIKGNKYKTYERNFYETSDERPEDSGFEGEARHHIQLKNRTIELRTSFEMKSNQKNFFVLFSREIYENDTLIKRREWKEILPRQFQ